MGKRKERDRYAIDGGRYAGRLKQEFFENWFPNKLKGIMFEHEY